MKVTLDLLTKKHNLYYVGLCITVITFSFIAIAGVCNLQSKSPLMPFYDTLLVICSLISCAFSVIVGTGLLGTYLKDGEFVLAEDYLVIDAIKIPLNEIKYINLKISPRNVKSHVLDKNMITLGDKNSNEYERRFAIKSYNQNKDFEKMLDMWRVQGVRIYAHYNGI
jgi:hypothetical protein